MNLARTEAETVAVIKQYSDTLYKIALSYTRCQATAEDIIQETFIKFMQSQVIFENAEHTKAWLIRVAINECKKFHRLFWNSKRITLEDIYSFELTEHHEVDYENQNDKHYALVISLDKDDKGNFIADNFTITVILALTDGTTLKKQIFVHPIIGDVTNYKTPNDTPKIQMSLKH